MTVGKPIKQSADPVPYDETVRISTVIDGRSLQVVTKPGVPGWDELSPGTFLLAEATVVSPESRVLVMGSPHGALAAVLARRAAAGEVVVFDRNIVVLGCARLTFARNGIENGHVLLAQSAIGASPEPFDVATLEIPNDRKLCRRWLVEAYTTLKPGGSLYLAGANRQGIKSIISDAGALFGDAAVVRYRQGHRVARAVRTDGDHDLPDWFHEPGIHPGTWHEFEVTIRGYQLRMRSLPGVFSYGKLDDGTAFLLETAAVAFTGRVLDLGCGCGVIGLVAARDGADHVDMVDANLLAVAAARENIAHHALDHAEALAGDVIEPVRERWYDVVVTNPPFHVGDTTDVAVAHALIAGARRVLRPGGRFFLVANRPLVYEPILRARFANITRIAASNRYAVWLAE